MQHEAFVDLAAHHLDLLLVVGGPERGGDERLRLAAGEHGRPVRAWQHAHLDPDRADLVECAAVEPHATVEHRVAQHLLLELLEDGLRLAPALNLFFRHRADQLLEDLVHRRVALDLVLKLHRLGERQEDLLLDLAVEVAVDLLRGRRHLGLARFLRHPVDHVHDLLDRGVSGLEGRDHQFLADDFRARLDHHQAVLASGDDHVETRLLALGVGRVHHDLVADQRHPHRRDGLLNRNLRQRHRGPRTGDGQHVRVVVGVGREHQGDDLSLVMPAGWEQRAQRPVDGPARQHFLLGGLALAFEEPAGDSTRRVRVFPVVDGERQEVDSLALGLGVAGRDEHDGVAVADDDRGVGLLGQLARLNRQDVLADGDLSLVHESCLDDGALEPLLVRVWGGPGRPRGRGGLPPWPRERSSGNQRAREGTQGDWQPRPARSRGGRRSCRATCGCRGGGSNPRIARCPSA